jgi:hypothetical protein
MSDAYLLTILTVALGAAAYFWRRALNDCGSAGKVALMHALARTRALNAAVLLTFAALLLWRVAVGWTFLACVGLIVPVGLVPYLLRLDLPREVAMRLVAAHLLATCAIVSCSAMLATRAYR